MKVTPNAAFAGVSHPFAFIVPGGITPTLKAMSNPGDSDLRDPRR